MNARMESLGITPLARVVSSGVSGLNPEIMGLGPIDASRQAPWRPVIETSPIAYRLGIVVRPCSSATTPPHA